MHKKKKRFSAVKQKLVLWFRKANDFFSDLVFPDNIKCVFCNEDIPNFEEKPYCENCENLLDFNNSAKCIICAEPIDNEASVCDYCQKHHRYFKKAFCPFLYDGIVRKAILGYKDSNQRYKAKVFAKYIAKEIEDKKIVLTYITYVPLSAKKTKKRGFDQAKLLAEKIAEILNVPMICLFKRDKEGVSQKYLDHKQREENMKGMYSLVPFKLKKQDIVLIVDDIITTGSTINCCSQLISKKVKEVYVGAIARNKLKRHQK